MVPAVAASAPSFWVTVDVASFKSVKRIWAFTTVVPAWSSVCRASFSWCWSSWVEALFRVVSRVFSCVISSWVSWLYLFMM